MDARKGNIFEILNGNKQFLIPVYQRYYSWDIEQCRRLWNDIVDMQKTKQGWAFCWFYCKHRRAGYAYWRPEVYDY